MSVVLFPWGCLVGLGVMLPYKVELPSGVVCVVGGH